MIYFTSGTTGHPKMVIHESSYALAHLITAKFWQDLKPTDLHWTFVPDIGWAKTAWGCFGQWIIGAAIFLHAGKGRFDPKLTLELIETYGITTFCAAPGAYKIMLQEDLEKYNLKKLRYCCSAGTYLSPEVIEVWQEKTGLQIHDGFGQDFSMAMTTTGKIQKKKLREILIKELGLEEENKIETA